VASGGNVSGAAILHHLWSDMEDFRIGRWHLSPSRLEKPNSAKFLIFSATGDPEHCSSLVTLE
jgi:hypothetical protein